MWLCFDVFPLKHTNNYMAEFKTEVSLRKKYASRNGKKSGTCGYLKGIFCHFQSSSSNNAMHIFFYRLTFLVAVQEMGSRFYFVNI